MISPSFELALPVGLESGGKLRDCHRLAHTETGVSFPVGTTLERYRAYGQMLAMVTRALPYWRSDWMRAVYRDHPDEAPGVVHQLGFSWEEISVAATLAFVPEDARKAMLSVQHHTVIGELIEARKIDDAGAKQWLGIADAEKLSPSELRDSIAKGEIVRNPVASATSNRGTTVGLFDVRNSFTRWQALAEKQMPIDQMALPIQEQIFEEIRPIGELYEKLKGKLNK